MVRGEDGVDRPGVCLGMGLGEQEKKMQEHIDKVTESVDAAAQTDGPHLQFEGMPQAQMIGYDPEQDASVEIEVRIGSQRFHLTREFPNDGDVHDAAAYAVSNLATLVVDYMEEGKL